MAKSQPTLDRLRLAGNPTVLKMIAKKGAEDETVVLSAQVEKVNKKGKKQTRVLMITTRALYNLAPNEYSRCKRRMALEDIDSVIVSTISNEVLVHIPSEYDYKLVTEFKDQISSVIQEWVERYAGRKIKIQHVKQDNIPFFDSGQAPPSPDGKDEKLDDMHEDTVELLKSKEKVSLKSFEVLQVIGKGAFGKVVKVKKKDSGSVYAMKILKKKFIVDNQKVEATLVERSILSCFENPFIMTLRYAFQTKDKLYLVMDFYKGGELYVHLEKIGRFTEDEARFIIAEIALAVGHLHSLHFIHRDLKPENVLMDESGHLCLTDFGLAKKVDPDEPVATTFVGTPQYIAPEIVKQEPHSTTVDWWSLGIMLYELVVGIPPFYSDNMNEMFEKITKAPLRFPSPETIPMSTELKHLISRLLIRDPNERLGAVNDIDDIIAHPFFNAIDWEKLFKKEIPPPFQPAASKDKDHTPRGSVVLDDTNSFMEHTGALAATASGNEFLNFTYIGNRTFKAPKPKQ